MVRKIEYTVSESGIAPAVTQFGGVQGEHRATELSFSIENALWKKLKGLVANEGGELIYRFDGYDGEGGVHRSDTASLTESVSYLLEEQLTRYGGTVRVVLVVSFVKSDTTEMELYSFPAMLKLKGLPMGTESEDENHESMSTLAEIAKAAAIQTEQDRDFVEDAEKRVAENLAGYIPLNANLEIVFDGGDSSTEMTMYNTVVLNRILETADYVVEEGTKTITHYIDNDASKPLQIEWHYHKKKNGEAECWFNSVILFNSAEDSKVLTGIPTRYKNTGELGEGIFIASTRLDLPLEFVDMPTIVGTCGWIYTEWLQTYPSKPAGEPWKAFLRLFCNSNSYHAAIGVSTDTANPSGAMGIPCNVVVKGRWK